MSTLKMFGDWNFPKFCPDCGRKLVEIKYETGKYDMQTGAKKVHTKLRCPFLWGAHWEQEFDEDGHEIISYW